MASAPLLQPVWNFVLGQCGDVASHWLFPSIVGFIAYGVVGIYFTLKDIGPWKSPATRINQDCWPEAKEIFWVAGIQMGVYATLNIIMWNALPHHVQLPFAAPTFYEVLRDLTISLLIGDFLVYVEHFAHHKISILYKKVHYVHHRFKKDLFSWCAGWVHPSELTIFALCMIVYPTILYPIHPLTFWVYEFIFISLLLEEHSNHDVWWSPGHWIPSIFGGAVPHDVHHIKVKTNYGFLFTIWDRMFGTFLPPASKEQ